MVMQKTTQDNNYAGPVKTKEDLELLLKDGHESRHLNIQLVVESEQDSQDPEEVNQEELSDVGYVSLGKLIKTKQFEPDEFQKKGVNIKKGAFILSFLSKDKKFNDYSCYNFCHIPTVKEVVMDCYPYEKSCFFEGNDKEIFIIFKN